jgi:hypothetical protein
MAVGTNSRWRTDVIGEMYVLRYFWDYIKIYEPIAASLLCDREEMMAQTENGFHYVDEAAPPALMRALASRSSGENYP